MYSLNPDETIDDLDCFKIIQSRNGYRFSADSVLLANFALPLKSTDSVIDIGTGSGVIPLILAQKSPVQSIIGIEIQEGLADIAKRNVEFNNLCSRIKIIKGDFRDIISISNVPCSLDKNGMGSGGREALQWEKGWVSSFSVVISNPPYTKPASGRISPYNEKAKAKAEITCSLSEIVKASRHMAAGKGRIIYIYPVSRLKEMLSVMENNKLEPARLEFVEPRPGCRVKRFLIEAVKKE